MTRLLEEATMQSHRVNAGLLFAVTLLGAALAHAGGPAPSEPDPYVARPRVVVMTDIANEPDDQMSLVRFLLYSNQLDVEGLVASTSTWMKSGPRPDVIRTVLDAYEQVQPNLLKHAAGFPAAAALREVVVSGQPAYGMAAVGEGKSSAGSELILRAAERGDARPLWVLAWGGTNTLAQALSDARRTRTPAQLEAIVSKLRVYAISDQDDAGAWLRREFPSLRYVAMPSTQNGEEYYLATWTGISGDRFYRNAPGADFTTFSDEWVNANIRAKGPLGKLYPYPCCIYEGDTPSFLGLIDNGLASAISPAFGGWGGRYVWRQPRGETRPFWTQGGDSYPGNDSSRDTLTIEGRSYTSDQATIWRWRSAFQNDFAARMDWTIKERAQANHNPTVVVNGKPGSEPLVIDAPVGTAIPLDAAGTSDPDGQPLTYMWFFYPEAATGIPGHPVRVRQRPAGLPPPGQGDIPSAPAGGPHEPPPRLVIESTIGPRATVVAKAPGVAHVILAVEDGGTPSLTSYRRIILNMRLASASEPPPPHDTGQRRRSRSGRDGVRLPLSAGVPVPESAGRPAAGTDLAGAGDREGLGSRDRLSELDPGRQRGRADARDHRPRQQGPTAQARRLGCPPCLGLGREPRARLPRDGQGRRREAGRDRGTLPVR
jgi:hypothetical protein